MNIYEKIIVISIIAVILAFSFDAMACETPTSDEELAEKYFICKGGFCLKANPS